MASVTFLKNQHYSESGKRSQLQYLYDHNKNKPDWIFDAYKIFDKIKLSTVYYDTNYTKFPSFELNTTLTMMATLNSPGGLIANFIIQIKLSTNK